MTTFPFRSLRARSLRATGAAFWMTVATVATLAACAHSTVLTPGEIGRSGVHVFSAPPEHVFYACLGILKADGYEIASANPEKGTIVTKPMAFESAGGATARGYHLTISSQEGSTKVVATPVLFAGERDVSAKEVWDVSAERAQWAELFADVDAVIAEPVRTEPVADQQEAVATTVAPTDQAGADGANFDRTPAKRKSTSSSDTPAGFTRATLNPTASRPSPGTATPAP